MIAPAPASVIRASVLARLAEETFDVVIVGGGATGAAMARDAALRGLRVALLERTDFAGETSSYSSKLIHGGLRYLEHGDLPLVFEALADRNRLMRAAPHLCRPVDFVLPGYRGQSPSHAKVGLGIALYNALALYLAPARQERWSAARVWQEAPLLRSAGLVGAHIYVDCQTNDARLVLENVLDAEEAGAACVSYVHVEGVLRSGTGHIRGVVARDREEGTTLTIRTMSVVNATGPYSDAFDAHAMPPRRRIRPTLGVHVVVAAERLPTGGRAFLLRAPRDGRVYFVLPAGLRTIIGTTDTDHPPPEPGTAIEADADDVAYLLEAANNAFPPARLGPDDVISTFAGLRPLLASDEDDPSATSREHGIWVDHHGLLTIAGGKLTTMRSMAEQAVDRLVELVRARGGGAEVDARPCSTRTRPLPGGRGAPPPLGDLAVPDEIRRHLLETYGARAGLVADLVRADPALGQAIDPELPVLWAEVVFATRHEHVVDLLDVMRRRTTLFRDARDQGLAVAGRVAEVVGAELSWSVVRRERALMRYRAALEATRAWRSASPRTAKHSSQSDSGMTRAGGVGGA